MDEAAGEVKEGEAWTVRNQDMGTFWTGHGGDAPVVSPLGCGIAESRGRRSAS